MHPQDDSAALVYAGAQIIDVRTKEEYEADLSVQFNKISKERPIIVCCASGMRSHSAKTFLQVKGYTVYNGGGWTSLQEKIYNP